MSGGFHYEKTKFNTSYIRLLLTKIFEVNFPKKNGIIITFILTSKLYCHFPVQKNYDFFDLLNEKNKQTSGTRYYLYS